VIEPIRRATPLPIVVDPSHSAGDWTLVAPMAHAACGAGADGLLVEVVEPGADRARLKSDAKRGVPPAVLAELISAARQPATPNREAVVSGVAQDPRRRS
jgi:3-deoxy-7-phosphoheptulonate synthase